MCLNSLVITAPTMSAFYMLYIYIVTLLQVDFTLTISATWLKTARSVQMVPLLHMTKHQEHERKIASLVPMVSNYFIV